MEGRGESQRVVMPPAQAGIFLVVTVRPGAEETVRELFADVSGLTKSVGFRVPDGQLSCVVGIGADLWSRLFGVPRPAGLHPFQELTGAVHHAPSTPGDLLFHLRARRMDLCFEMTARLLDRLAGRIDVADEVHGFKYFDERDLLGFVDGTANPEGAAADAAVFVGDEDPEFAGGSYVIVQKYLHDLDAWNALPTEEQERVIGRSKLNDIEMPDAVKPTNSHVALTTIIDGEGREHDIVRDNMPFGTFGTGEFGTYFIGYSATPDVTEQMLRNMFIGNPPGNHDRILDFSTAVTGGLFFVPTAEFLDDPPAHVAVPQATAAEPPTADDSLRIGSLNRSSAS
ncbi:Dyp-type peroxidase [Actinomadura meridiana]|uniref:Dyp-type peroxidase n=1 Tax=Actinomadura meridiana TaxID=559626 RepID=A0ABP8CDL3_9ACTN